VYLEASSNSKAAIAAYFAEKVELRYGFWRPMLRIEMTG
jgi:hypothetical protein